VLQPLLGETGHRMSVPPDGHHEQLLDPAVGRDQRNVDRVAPRGEVGGGVGDGAGTGSTTGARLGWRRKSRSGAIVRSQMKRSCTKRCAFRPLPRTLSESEKISSKASVICASLAGSTTQPASYSRMCSDTST
jgi:hypothetical protein